MSALREAYRSYRRAPGIWAGIVLSLALGTGANLTLFSIINGLMLRPLPVRDPDGLAVLRELGGDEFWSYPIWQELQSVRGVGFGAAAWASQTFNTAPPGRSSIVNGIFVSAEFFPVLGIAPARGQFFDGSDDRLGGGARGPVAVISDRLWQSRFDGAADVVGRTLLVEGVTFTIIGVTPRGFLGPEVGTAFDVAVPFGAEPVVRPLSLVKAPRAQWLNIMVRIEPGRTRADAVRRLREFQPLLRERVGALTRAPEAPFDLVAAGHGISPLRERYRQPLAVLSVVAALVLMIACANIANLLLVRAQTARREIAVRLALGASTRSLVTAMMAESAVLIGAGCAAGALLAWWGSGLFVTQVTMQGDAATLDLSLDWRVFAFACTIAALTLLASSLLPALRACRTDASSALMAHGYRVSGAGGTLASRGGHALVVLQIAFTLMMLVAAGLFVRTFAALLTQPLGFERDKVLVVRVDSPRPPVPTEAALQRYDRIREAAEGVPGVERVSLSAMTPLGGTTTWQILFELPGEPRPPSIDERTVVANIISPDYFATFGTRIVSGREFLATDHLRGAPVAIVNQAFVARFLAGSAAVGRTVRHVGFVGRPSVDREIVGVVEDAAYRSLRAMNRPTLYVPLVQRPQSPPVIFVGLRSSQIPPARLGNTAIDALAPAAPEASFSIATLDEQVNGSIAQERLVAVLSGFFGALALLLAGLGLYGVTAHAVGQRRRELGIRLALGARPDRVVRMVLGRVAALVTLGVAIGTGLSLAAGPFVASLLYGLSPRDPFTIAACAALVGFVGGVAGLVPALHAARVDPAEVLRAE